MPSNRNTNKGFVNRAFEHTHRVNGRRKQKERYLLISPRMTPKKRNISLSGFMFGAGFPQGTGSELTVAWLVTDRGCMPKTSKTVVTASLSLSPGRKAYQLPRAFRWILMLWDKGVLSKANVPHRSLSVETIRHGILFSNSNMLCADLQHRCRE